MADLIDRAALLADIDEAVVFSGRNGQSAEMRGANKIIDRIKAASAVDAVPVVRCGNCRYFFVDEYYAKHGLCRAYPLGIAKLPMDYCSLGERRTDGSTD